MARKSQPAQEAADTVVTVTVLVGDKIATGEAHKRFPEGAVIQVTPAQAESLKAAGYAE
jgi:hypothetical protein